MKVKEIDRTANIAWSPAQQFPIYIAAGTAAQQLDATFSTNAALEIYLFNPESKSLTCKNVSTAQVEHRFNKVVWGNQGMGRGDPASSGLLVGAMDNGLIYVWDAARLLHHDSSRLHTLGKQQTSSGSSSTVTSLDFNPFQPNLLASGGGDSEIFIWDMNNTSNPMAPGTKSQPLDEVTCLAWNRQVQHILASTLSSRCIVWDLRKNEPIIKISDSMSRIKSKTVVWHPEVATQMCLSSEDDHTPVIQLWDLRYAASPVKVLEKHERGILSMAWCSKDSDLLLSCSKDNRILCWNPNSSVQGGEVLYELPSNQWCFDVQWCPRNPQVISASSFEGHIGIYTLMGGEVVHGETSQAQNKIADSFGAIDDTASVQAVKQRLERHVVPPLARAPKWLKRPCGVSFGFGGKLVTFSDEKLADIGGAEHSGSGRRSVVTLSTVVTEEELLERSRQLEQALCSGQHREYCAMKVANSEPDSHDQQLWSFLQANFDANASRSFLHLLGFDESNLAHQVKSMTLGQRPGSSASATTGHVTTEDDDDNEARPSEDASTSNLLTSSSHLSSTSAGSDGESSAFDNIKQPPAAVRCSSPSSSSSASLLIQCDTESSTGLLTRALLTGNIQLAVDICLRDERLADALILAASQGAELFEQTMKQYFTKRHDVTSRLISSVVNRKYADIVHTCSLNSWKEALALVLTYAKPEELRPLCDALGARLENEGNGQLAPQAVLCYVCSGNVSKFVEAWQAAQKGANAEPLALQDLVEKVTLLRHAVNRIHNHASGGKSKVLEHKLAEYGELLASQGSLQVALAYLTSDADGGKKEHAQATDLGVLCHRVARALGQQSTAPWRVQAPAQKAEVKAAQSRAAAGSAVPSAAGVRSLEGKAAAVHQESPQQQQQRLGPVGGRTSSSAALYGNSGTHQVAPYGGAGAQPFYTADARHATAQQPQPSGYYHGLATAPGSGAAAAGYGGAAAGYGAAPAAYGGTAASASAGGYTGGSALHSGPATYQPQLQAATVPSQAVSSYSGSNAAQPGAYMQWSGQHLSTAQPQAGHIVTRGLLAQKYAAVQTPSPGQNVTTSTAQQLPNTFNPALVPMSSQGLTPLPTFGGMPAAAEMYNPPLAPAVPLLTVPMPQQPVNAYASGGAMAEEVRYEDSKVPAGWNDPPVIQHAAPQKKKAPAAAYSAGGGGTEAGGMGDQTTVGAAPGQASFSTAHTVSHYYNPNEYQQQQHPPPSPKESAFIHEAAHATALKQPKAPIPAEHQVLCDIFNSVAYKCLDSADTVQTKRKVEVVLTELEALYDRLREQHLSPPVLLGLHQIAQAIQAADYPGSLNVVAAVIAQGNFSEIGTFMPGIKMLLQTALRLHVYL